MRYADWPWTGEEGPRSREEEKDGPDICSLREVWQQVKGWRSQPVVSFRDAQLRWQMVPRVDMASIPFQEVDSQPLKTKTENSPAKNMAYLPGLGVRGLVIWKKQEVSHKGQYPTNELATLAPLRCNERGGREGVLVRPMMLDTWKPTGDSPYLVPNRGPPVFLFLEGVFCVHFHS